MAGTSVSSSIHVFLDYAKFNGNIKCGYCTYILCEQTYSRTLMSLIVEDHVATVSRAISPLREK